MKNNLYKSLKFGTKKRFRILFIASLLLFSCVKQSEISNDFNCEKSAYSNLENVEDIKNLFSLKLPKNWKINLYQDESQSSIFAADTTKQLTETVLIDVTFIKNKITFDDVFMLQQEQENLTKGLIKIKSKEITLLEKPSFYTIYKGKKGAFLYQTCHTFIKINAENFILAKTEIYGDSLVNERFCNSFSLIENIKIHP
ncbi:hypothetical protein [Polaribacter glomeratus]|uniref:PsbP C-terminal domain-containing protein n=1 Tax=Polaribacter glomeratus TaxID=102 RepID=A0A2S7WW50_9FLAO|nr:hypothetical protein [Polaribacter glomeratus]PQJ81706.1 hypothetical protein BTO16_03595 [Polaribacter glomeratus]TXD66369.1 hypothetical protein ESX12_06180 [Polaribacter glomeratus]